MSRNIPISGFASSVLPKYYALPSSEDVGSFVASSRFPQDLKSFLAEHNITLTQDKPLEGINVYYQEEKDDILQNLSSTTPAAIYLGLNQDFENLKNQALSLQTPHTEFGTEAVNTLLHSLDQLRYGQNFRATLGRQSHELARATESIDLVAELEKAYLQILQNYLGNHNRFFSQLIHKKIQTYVLMTALRRMEKGESQQSVLERLHPLQDSTITALSSFAFGDIVGEIGQYLDLSVSEISVTHIETELLQQEIAVVNQAYLYGGDERVVQYIETLYHLFTNLKLAYFQVVFQKSTQHIHDRMINYSQK